MADKVPYPKIMERMYGDINYIAEEAYHDGYDQCEKEMREKIEEAYHRGLAEGKKAFDLLYAERNAEYQRGFEEGKAQIELGCEGCKHEGSSRALSPCRFCTRNSTDYWTAKQTDNCIEIGDEVEWDGDKYIVTYRNKDINTGVIQDYDLMMWDGSVVDHVKKCSFVKTGNHYDIASILKEMRS